MGNINKSAEAEKVYQTLIQYLDGRNWKYERNDKERTIVYHVTGEDLQMKFYIFVDEERQLIRMIDFMPFNFPKEKALDGAIAASVASYGMVDGSFACDITNGAMKYVITSSFYGCSVGPGVFEYMMNLSHSIVDQYNDKFLALAKGMINIQDFIKQEA